MNLTADTNAQPTGNETGPALTPQQSITLKRQVTVKSVVNDQFKAQANQELAQETQMIDEQLRQLEAQYQYTLQQLEQMAKQGQAVQPQLNQLNKEAQEKRTQLAGMKMELSTQLANLDKVPNGSLLVTGMLENYIDIRLGDKLHDKIQSAEIILENGVVKAILSA